MTKIDITPKYSDVKPEGYYVYLHRRATDGSVFYVGKGKARRGWDYSRGRNKHWLRVSRKNSVVIEIVSDGMSEPCALTLERILIHKYGIGSLANLTDGGEGCSGYVTPPEVRKKQSLAKKGKKRGPLSKETREKISKSHIGLRPTKETLEKLRISHLGQRKRDENNKFDPIIRVFRHPEHGEFVGVQYDLRHKYKLSASCLSGLIKGNRISVKGWTYHGEYGNVHNVKKED